MRVSAIDVTGNLVTIEIDGDSLIEDLKALVEVEMNIPFAQQSLLFNNKQLDNKQTLNQSGIKDGDMVQVQNNAFANILSSLQNLGRQQGNQGNQQGGLNFGGFNQANALNQALRKEADEIKKHYESSPNDLQYILHQNPEFAQAVLNEDINVLIEYIKKAKDKKRKEELAHLERLRKLEEDPFNPDNQMLIEEEIRMKNVNENMEFAQEYTPEVFGSVTMLYIDAKINGHAIQAFVDSGAQSTIMSHKAAERCGLLHLLDKRFAGIAMGVGTSRILGRVHSAKMEIGNTFFQCSITILEDDKVEFLFGLDMLKRHQCTIDLNKNILTFHGGQLSVPFLAEGDIKKHFAAAANQDKKLVGSEKIPIAVDSKTEKSLVQGGAFPEEDINKLISLGFTRTQSIQALKVCQGNVDMAASFLFQS